MKNMPNGAINPQEVEEGEDGANQEPSPPRMPQVDQEQEREAQEDTFIPQDHAEAQASDVGAPQPPPQVIDRRSTPMLLLTPFFARCQMG